MITIVTAENIHLHHDVMEQAYRLRHDVFVDEMGWDDMRRADGREIDQFDNDRAVHMLYCEAGRVLGYQRLLPTTSPHLLSDVFPQLCDGEFPAHPRIWEWTRYCVARPCRDRGKLLSPIGSGLLLCIVEWGLARGIDAIVIEMNPIWLLRLVQLHFRVRPLGLPMRVGNADVVAVVAAFDRRTQARLHEVRDSSAPVLPTSSAESRKLTV